jgi:hypothetical protein
MYLLTIRNRTIEHIVLLDEANVSNYDDDDNKWTVT